MFCMTRFDGTGKVDFHTWKQTMLALAGIKEFDDALTTSLPIVNISPAATLADNQRKQKLAMSYLNLTLNGPPAAIIKRTVSGDPHNIWVALCNRYKPSNVESFNQIATDMENCRLEDLKADPEPWMQQLD